MKKNEKIIKELGLIFYNYKKLLNDLENNFIILTKNFKKKINLMNEIINFYKKKKLKVTLIIK